MSSLTGLMTPLVTHYYKHFVPIGTCE